MRTGKLSLRIPKGTREDVATRASVTIGRAPECTFVLDDPLVSRQHARVESYDDGTLLLIDLGSANGTWLNGILLSAPFRLRAGDLVKLGGTTLKVEIERPAEPDPELEDGDETGTHVVLPERRSLIGQSSAMSDVFRLIDIASTSLIPVLIEGETGTGKEVVARAIHAASPRAAGPFVAVNCATLVESLLETELFGHRRGAFTGADRDRAGLFEAASGGTIFLDELGEMVPGTQPKLLRVLEEGEVVRVGESKTRAVDVRVIAATNRDLQRDVKTGRFRGDLYFRLAAFPVRLPPLRERDGDVPLLARHALAAAAQRQGARVPLITDVAMRLLTRYDWPGNVRELRNEIERALALAREGPMVDVKHLSERVQSRSAGETRQDESEKVVNSVGSENASGGEPMDLRVARAAFEANHIAHVFDHHGRNIVRTAEALGLSRTALYAKLREYGIRS